MLWLHHEETPPDVAPDTMRIARRSNWAHALIVGFGPMKVASSAPAKMASTASVPALKIFVSRVDVLAHASWTMPLLDADERGSVGDVGEVAEPQRDRFGRASGRSQIGRRGVAAAGRREPGRYQRRGRGQSRGEAVRVVPFGQST